MGVTYAQLTIRNVGDLYRLQAGEIEAVAVRTLTVQALVDTGSYFCGLTRTQIEFLGLLPHRQTEILTGNGEVSCRVFMGASLETLGRSTEGEILELSDGLPPIIGFILLEALDLMVDPVAQIVKGRHGEKQQVFLLRHEVVE